MKAYEVAHLDELDRFPVDDEGLLWRPVRRHLGITAFGCNAYTAADAGGRVIERHSEKDGHEELYFVAFGHARFDLDGEEVDGPAGTLVHCPPGTTREARAVEPETTVIAFGAKPGVPHEISKWEQIYVAVGHLRRGEEAKAREAVEAAIAEHPDDWQGHYNAACIEARMGNRDEAFTHLRRAAELDAEAIKYAREDPDFEGLRDDPEFPA